MLLLKAFRVSRIFTGSRLKLLWLEDKDVMNDKILTGHLKRPVILFPKSYQKEFSGEFHEK